MILCVDTATKFAGVALMDKQKCYGYLPLSPGKYSDSILPTIDTVFKKAGIFPSDLTGVLVIKGPGSFTSLRVGIAITNQFAHQLKIPIIGLRTDEWWAYRTDEKNFVYLQSMNREELYVVLVKTGTSGACEIMNINALTKRYGRGVEYLGELMEEHCLKLSQAFHGITNLKSVQNTWLAAARSLPLHPRKIYDLIEPYYGKEPTITKSKRE